MKRLGTLPLSRPLPWFTPTEECQVNLNACRSRANDPMRKPSGFIPVQVSKG
jgi:hypothetical protein